MVVQIRLRNPINRIGRSLPHRVNVPGGRPTAYGSRPMHDNIRFWVATLIQVIGLAMFVGFILQSYRPSTRRMAQERRETFWKDLKNWSFPGTNDTEESMAKLTPYERRDLLMLALLIGGVVLLNVGQAMGGALRPPSQ